MSDLRVIPGGSNAAQPAPDRTAVMGPATQAKAAASALAMKDPGEALKPGSTLGNYLIVSKLGEGGMGIVYKAQDTVLNRTVALKVLSPHLFRNQEFLQRFRTEAQLQARLNGPNIVMLHSMFETPLGLVLVMEYVEGHNLQQRLHNEGRLSVATTVWVFEQALLGVERAHRMGIVHRDLKPSNIFITNTHEIKLMDFGVAKMLDSKELTQVGSMIGTLMYISPEQIRGEEADFRSDIYTMGVSLYEAVTGVLPFEKKTDYEYMDAHLHEEPIPPTALRPDIPQELEEIILKSLAKEPDKRYQTAHEFRKALLKVGMVHVRAYRRLKNVRHERERAALSVPDTRSGRDKDSRARYLGTIALAALGSSAAIALAITMMARQPEPIAAPTATPTPVAAPAPVEPLASGVSPVAITPSTPAATAPASVPIPAATPEPAKPVVAATPDKKPAQKPVARPKVDKPKAAPANKDKYDDLRKAWGG